MCVRCAGGDDVDHDAHLLWLIHQHGWAIQAVRGDNDENSFYYTVGLTEKGFPELLVSGVPQSYAGALLSTLAGQQVDGGEFPNGHVTDFGGLRVVLSGFAETEGLLTAQRFYPGRVRVLAIQRLHEQYPARYFSRGG